MGTTLTGTTPQDTYDSLIKVTDNGPLTGSLKKLTDGLGNDSSLSLSTTAASLSGTLAVTGATTLSSSLTANGLIKSTVAGAGFRHFYNNGAASIEVSQRSDNKLQLYAYTGSAYTDILLGVDGSAVGGNVGIGVSTPVAKLSVSNSTAALNVFRAEGVAANLYIDHAGSGNNLYDATNHKFRSFAGVEVVNIDANGIKFNGDTAAANALDDYEEGTWTMGFAFGGASVGVTASVNTGTYTKIGRQVTVNGVIVLTSKGSSTGSASVTGLPFTIANTTANYASVSLRLKTIAFANQFQGFGEVNTTTITLEDISAIGVITDLNNTNFADNSQVTLNFTYFV